MISRMLYVIFIGVSAYGIAEAGQILGIAPFWHGLAFGLIFLTLLAILMEIVE